MLCYMNLPNQLTDGRNILYQYSTHRSLLYSQKYPNILISARYLLQYQDYHTYIMEKYRRWTDEATGINPFISARTTPIKISTVLISAIIAVIKLHGVMLLFLPIIFSLILQQYMSKIPVVGDLNKLPLKLLNKLLGLWNMDDGNFKKWAEKNKNKGSIILSNSVCILDAFYYLATLNSVKFIVSNPSEEKFEAIGGLSAVLAVLSSKQPFFNVQPSPNSIPFKTLISRQIANGTNCIIFYEGIRTNGLGTIKISTKLANQLYSLQKDYCISHLRYQSAPEGLFSTVSMPLILFFVALGECNISLKVRCNPVAISSQHSGVEVQKDIDSFLMANAAKLLDTIPISYFDFLEYYAKSQNQEYTKVGQVKKE